jgi:hypothetical protein
MMTPADTQNILQTTGYHVKLGTQGSTDSTWQYFGAWQGGGSVMAWNFCRGYTATALKLPSGIGSLSMATGTGADSAWLLADSSKAGENGAISVSYSIYFWADAWGYCLQDRGRYRFHDSGDKDRAFKAIDRLKKFAGWYSHRCRRKCAIIPPAAQTVRAAAVAIKKTPTVDLLGRGVRAGGTTALRGVVIVNGEKQIR